MTTARDHFDCTPQQYHSGLDKLWAALEISGVQDEDVFTLTAREVNRLQAIVDKLPGWQPFATAPKDNTEIIVWRKDAGSFAAIFSPPNQECRDMAEADGDDNDWCWFTSQDEDLTGNLPTLWMPMPIPDERQVAEAAKERSDD